jgi:hypothetical protein
LCHVFAHIWQKSGVLLQMREGCGRKTVLGTE